MHLQHPSRLEFPKAELVWPTLWTLTQGTLGRARDESKTQHPIVGRFPQGEGEGRAGYPTDPAYEGLPLRADVIRGRCLAGEGQRGCWNPV